MWFMVYKGQSYGEDGMGGATYSQPYTGNCVVDTHPVLVLDKWNKTHSGAKYVLLFYDKLSEEVAAKARGLEFNMGGA